jgi:hypothetical protein
MTTRRRFILTVLPATALAVGARATSAQAARLAENDPQAIALGYQHDATKVDAKKFPRYAAGQICANCQLYQGKASEEWAPCSAFAGKLVNAKGWCSAWVKKAA